jgi:ankyrin repeat protein
MGREDIAQELIRRGSKLELTDFNDMTPLYLWCHFNYQATAHALVLAGANINSSAHPLLAPLGVAAQMGHLDLVRNLLLWGADPSQKSRSGNNTARSFAENRGFCKIVTLLDTSASILVVRSAQQVHRLAWRSSLKRLPKDLCRLVGSMLLGS